MSFVRAARKLGIEPICFDTADASGGNRFLARLRWRWCGRRPLYLERFSDRVVEQCAHSRPDILIATGAAPLTRAALQALRALGVCIVNYSTDDPWNPGSRSHWHMQALPFYDIVFTTRRVNIKELQQLGCADVRYLPFGFDETLLASRSDTQDLPANEVLFVGGADDDRVSFISQFVASGTPITLVGGYWDSYPSMRPYSLGCKQPAFVGALTVAAKVNLCLVRHANRDGHVMRSFEIAALGGCMLAEDTAEHREIFGQDGECVVYFQSAADAAKRAKALLSAPTERSRLMTAIRDNILNGKHSYTDRFATMVNAVLYRTAKK